MTKKKPPIKDYEDGHFICGDCAIQKGFRKPNLGSVQENLTTCEHCGKMAVCLEREDLLAPWEDDDIWEQ